VEAWQKAFLLAAQGLGQGRSYGMQNLKAVRQEYPWAAALGYSRKALYADAVAVSMAGAEGVLQKPQGPDDPAIAQATTQQAPALAQAAYQAVDRRLMQVLAPMALRLALKGDDASLALAIFQALSARQDDTMPAARCLEDLAQAEQGHPLLEPDEAQAVLALRDWVQAWG
jgi:DNA-binding NarL/FixJ family response regulator